jgi:hypothetical protein
MFRGSASTKSNQEEGEPTLISQVITSQTNNEGKN